MAAPVSFDSLLSELKAECHVLSDFVPLRAKQFPDKTALRQFDRESNVWREYSFAWLEKEIARWRRALEACGLARGDRVGILLNNSVNAVLADQSVLANALIPVPMHAIDTPRSSAYLLSDSGASCFITNKLERWQSISRCGIPLPALKTVVLSEEPTPQEADTSGVRLVGLAEWLKGGESVETLPAGPLPSDLAAIVYTSGTTGNPKGVMLTHANIVFDILAALSTVPDVMTPDFTLLSFLPLSHTFERTAGYYLALGMALTVSFNRSIALLSDDLKTVRPHMLLSVPRIYERVYAKINASLEKAPALSRMLFNACVATGWRNHCRDHKMPVPASVFSPLDRLLGPLLRRLVARKVLAAFGGRLQLAIAGGAALSLPVARMFCGLGLHIIQGYGMTESSPVVSVNTKTLNDPRTVGQVLPGIELRLDATTQEIQLKAPSVMLGYWHRPEETQQTIRDGWLCTGDVGELDSLGQLKIRGRIKEIIVTCTGEKVPPVDLENALENDPLFTQTCVLGDDRPYITFLAVLNFEEWKKIAEHFNVDPNDPQAYRLPAVRTALMRRAKVAAAGFPHYALPRDLVATFEPWTIENGLLTPTLKIKRKPLYEKFKDEIDALYAIHG